jgi:hypothetical protein
MTLDAPVKCCNAAGELLEEKEIPSKAGLRERTNLILEAFPTINPSRDILVRINEHMLSLH